MSEDTVKLTSETALIMEKMVSLNPEDSRYQVLKAVVDYKASWIELAEHLNVVAANKEFKQWGYSKFKDYCDEELHIPSSMASKLVKSFQWVDREIPELLPRYIDEEGGERAAAKDGRVDEDVPRVLPDIDTVNVLLKAEREVAKDRLSQDVYDELKEKALKGEDDIKDLKKTLKESIVEPEKDLTLPKEQIKILRRSLSATEKIVTQLEESLGDDEELFELAQKLREKLFERVSAMLDAEAYGDAKADDGQASE